MVHSHNLKYVQSSLLKYLFKTIAWSFKLKISNLSHLPAISGDCCEYQTPETSFNTLLEVVCILSTTNVYQCVAESRVHVRGTEWDLNHHTSEVLEDITAQFI
mgnify:CR=1 FL=1